MAPVYGTRFLAVQVGSYELKAELSGFGSVNVTGITVDPGSNQRFSLQLKVGPLEVDERDEPKGGDKP